MDTASLQTNSNEIRRQRPPGHAVGRQRPERREPTATHCVHEYETLAPQTHEHRATAERGTTSYLPRRRAPPGHMVAIGQVFNSIHLVVAGLWAGAVLFATVGLLPLARAGEIDAGPTRSLLDRLTWLSRGSSLVLLLTGAHLALTRYPGDALLGTGDGHLVVTMVVLWIGLSGLVEVGTSKFDDALDQQKVRTGADDAQLFFRLASVVAVALLLLGGWLV